VVLFKGEQLVPGVVPKTEGQEIRERVNGWASAQDWVDPRPQLNSLVGRDHELRSHAVEQYDFDCLIMDNPSGISELQRRVARTTPNPAVWAYPLPHVAGLRPHLALHDVIVSRDPAQYG